MPGVRAARFGLLWGLAFLGVVACGRDDTTRAVADKASDDPSEIALAATRELLLETAASDELAPGEEHRYTLELTAGDFVQLVVEQDGIDVASTLLGPDAAPLIRVDRPVGYLGPEPLMAVATATGQHTLLGQALDSERPAGAYRVELRERRPTTPQDRQRAEAAALLAGKADLPRALELWQALGDDFWQAETLYRLGAAAQEPAAALSAYERSAALYAAAGDPRQQGFVLNQIGVLHHRDGRPEQAIARLEQALDVQRSAGARLGEAISSINLGQIRRTQGRYHEAQQLYRQALEALDEQRDRLQRAQTFHNLGVLYRILHRDELAEDYLTRAAGAAAGIGYQNLQAAALNQLGKLEQQRGETSAALPFHQRALELRSQTGHRRGEANTLIDLGLSYRTLERLDEARTAYDTALAVLDDLPPRPRIRAEVLLALGALEIRLEQPTAAAEHLQQAVELARDFDDPAGEAEGLYRLAQANAQQGRMAIAHEAAAGAVELVERVRLSAISPELRSSFFSSVQPFFELQIDLLMRSHRQQPNAGYDARALSASERARARSLLDMLVEADADIRAGVDPTLLARESELQEALNRGAQELR
ncbi:MAG: tetratricopeptide repeat protein, partial [Acidobacteriota bacterium]